LLNAHIVLHYGRLGCFRARAFGVAAARGLAAGGQGGYGGATDPFKRAAQEAAMDSEARGIERDLADIVGPDQVFTGEAIGERYRLDMTRKYASKPAALVRPASTQEVAAVMRLAAERGCPVTVIGGQSGTTGAAVPLDGAIALSLERMNRIVEIDPMSMTMTVQAGCVLQTAHEAAEAQDLLLPLDLGSRGSATIGGCIGANAGGNRVLRWGMMRDMVIGLEAVLADGTVISSLTKMIKDNAGYNWKHLLIGSEGTLGVVTEAVLRLRPLPTTRQTAIVAMASFEDSVKVLRGLEVGLSGRLSSFELMWADFYDLITTANLPLRPRPLALGQPFYALVEAMGGDEQGDGAQFERVLTRLMDQGVVLDAVIAQSEQQREALWSVREDLKAGVDTVRPMGAYDVSMALKDMPAFVEAARRNLVAAYPEVKMAFYGHAGDGNLHALVSIGRMDKDIQYGFDKAVFDAVQAVGGSIAAEHGIGVSRAPFLPMTRSPRELELMRALKQTLDPQHLLNPGKLLDAI
jgi:FAD/FMN-containing dehydrogenase